MIYFTELGLAIREAWKAKRFVKGWLPEISASLLEENPPGERLSFTDIVEWAEASDVLPRQARLDEAFGQPPLTMFWDKRFRIDILFWHTGTTGIHQHQFCGAFSLLAGSSVHSKYEFTLRRSLGPGLKFGHISLSEVEFLTSGMVRQIELGPGLIHSLFHLDTPSVTVVVRTPSDPDTGPEFEYKPPNLAIDPSHLNHAMTKKTQLLRLLLRVGSTDYERMARVAVANSDLHTAFLVLRQARVHSENPKVFERLVDASRQRHGEDLGLLLPSLEEEWRRSLIIIWRKLVTDPNHRFFLALLMNLPSQAAISKVISSRHPDTDPLQLIQKWSREISDSNGIGIEFDDTIALLFRCLLERKSLEETLEVLRQEYPVESVDSQRALIEDACGRIQDSELLRPLFV